MSKEKKCNLNRIYFFFPKQCTGWVLFAYLQCPVGWCVRLPEISFPLVSHCLPTSVPVLMARPPPQGLVSPGLPLSLIVCLFLSPIVTPHVCPLDAVSAFPRSCLSLSPIVSTHVCLSWMVRRPSRGLVSACLPLSPIVSPHVCLCWLVRPPSRRLVFPCVG